MSWFRDIFLDVLRVFYFWNQQSRDPFTLDQAESERTQSNEKMYRFLIPIVIAQKRETSVSSINYDY